jgi:hypothetical protein
MRLRLKTYTAYSIGCAVVWAVILAIAATVGKKDMHRLLLVFAGWVLGWTSATIARYVYPPPKGRRPSQ